MLPLKRIQGSVPNSVCRWIHSTDQYHFGQYCFMKRHRIQKGGRHCVSNAVLHSLFVNGKPPYLESCLILGHTCKFSASTGNVWCQLGSMLPVLDYRPGKHQVCWSQGPQKPQDQYFPVWLLLVSCEYVQYHHTCNHVKKKKSTKSLQIDLSSTVKVTGL